MKPLVTALLAGMVILLPLSAGFALDAPHNTYENIGCPSCHVPHNTLGGNLTSQGVNTALCLSCHYAAGPARNLPFSDSDRAVPGVSGRSHNWAGSMPAVSNPSNQYGLRATANLTSSAMKARLSISGNVVVCSVCHDEHSQLNGPWEPFSLANRTVAAGTSTGGSTTTLADTSKTWTDNQWTNAFVKITNGPDPGTNLNIGAERRIVSNTANTLTVSPAFDGDVIPGDAYYLMSNRHMMRTANSANQMCKDCHYYRVQTDVTAYTGEMLSHPVEMTLAGVKDPTQFLAVPLEPASASFAAQTGTRGELNGGTDTNPTNNIVFDSTGKVQCLSCHGIHYADSNSSTVDKP